MFLLRRWFTIVLISIIVALAVLTGILVRQLNSAHTYTSSSDVSISSYLFDPLGYHSFVSPELAKLTAETAAQAQASNVASPQQQSSSSTSSSTNQVAKPQANAGAAGFDKRNYPVSPLTKAQLDPFMGGKYPEVQIPQKEVADNLKSVGYIVYWCTNNNTGESFYYVTMTGSISKLNFSCSPY